MPIEYKYLTEEMRQHFLEHGWIRVPKAMNQEIMKYWLSDVFARLPGDPNNPDTWEHEDVAMPRHREVPNQEMLGDAWQIMCELVGGIERTDPVRERMQGDQFIFNAGAKELLGRDPKDDIPPQQLKGWHTDNDWYTQFLDSNGNMLTVICCFTDIKPRGGGTWAAEDGIDGVVKFLYDHPEGVTWPYEPGTIYGHIPQCKKFSQVVGDAGDVFIMHAHLPHCVGKNYLRAPRIITNPHVNGPIDKPYNLNREDPSEYSLVEQVILNALSRATGRDFTKGIPDWVPPPLEARKVWYPRNYICKGSRIPGELKRMIEAKGGDKSKVDSIHLQPEKQRAYLENSGLNRPYGRDPWIPDTRPPGDYYAYPLEQMMLGGGTKHSKDGRARPE